MSRTSAAFEDRVMDALQDYPQTAGDLADRLMHHADRIRECLCGLASRGLVEQAGNVRRNGLWRMAKTKRRRA